MFPMTQNKARCAADKSGMLCPFARSKRLPMLSGGREKMLSAKLFAEHLDWESLRAGTASQRLGTDPVWMFPAVQIREYLFNSRNQSFIPN